MTTQHRLGERGHEHKDMKPVLIHYGAGHVPDRPHQQWTAMKCPFHEDHSASAQTDGVGFRCFTCSLFFPAPLALIRDQEGTDWQGAHDIYHRLAGASSSEVSDEPTLRFGVSGQQRHRATSRFGSQAGRRHRT